MTPTKKATKQPAKKADNYTPITVGNDDDSEVSDGVAVMRTSAGAGYLVPRSLKGLRGDAADCVGEIQKTAATIDQAQTDMSQLVAEARSLGVSWSGIGWSVGTTGEAARQRWGHIDG